MLLTEIAPKISNSIQREQQQPSLDVVISLDPDEGQVKPELHREIIGIGNDFID